MNKRYGIHPGEFALGETEKYYADMAAKGWALDKRGVTFSRFRKTQPRSMRYRVEVVSPQSLNNGRLPEEQIALYADCGWEYVSGRGFLHVFRAPEGSDAPEFYLEPQQQAETLKALRREYRSRLLRPFLYFGLQIFLFALMRGLFHDSWAAEFFLSWVEESEQYIGLAFLLLWLAAGDLWGLLHLDRLYRRMKQGVPLDHAPRSRKQLWLPQLVQLALLLCVLGCFAFDRVHSDKYLLDHDTQDPYLLLSELGVEGTRTVNTYSREESHVETGDTLMAQHWQVREFMLSFNGSDQEWLYQDVYRLKNEENMDTLVESLMANATFANSLEEFIPVELPGLDRAWVTERLECIAVKDTYAAMLTSLFESREDMENALCLLAEKWEKG